MKLINHGKAMNFKCENCECEWRAVEKECRESLFFEAPTKYLYNCPECGKPTWGVKITAPGYVDAEGTDADG